MADTLTPNLRLTNQTAGGNNNTWGDIADTNFEEIDDKFGDTTDISTSGGTTVLTEQQERVAAIQVAGTLASNATIEFSGRGGVWVIENNTSGGFEVTVKVTGETGIVVEQGVSRVVFCDGTDILEANSSAPTSAEVTVASGSTTNILGAESEFIAISGTSTITSLGTGTNRKRFVRATGAFTLTHHATSLICPGGHNIKAEAGDTFIVVSDASSNARIFGYQRAATPPASIPVGAVLDYAGTTAPSFYIFPYGQNVSRTTYAALFAVLGTTHGVGDGSTTFGLPDYRGRVSAGKDDMGGSAASRLTSAGSGVDGVTLGASGGAQTVTLSASNIPDLTIGVTITDPGHVHGSNFDSTSGRGDGPSSVGIPDASTPDDTQSATTGITASGAFGTTQRGGSQSAVNKVPPTIVMNKIMFTGAV